MSVLLCLTVICMDTGTDVHAGYYEDNDKYIKQRVADRMKEMSWEEKIAQMILVDGGGRCDALAGISGCQGVGAANFKLRATDDDRIVGL